MKKEVLKQLISRPTKRIRILGIAGTTIVMASLFAYYIGVVSPAFGRAFSGSGEGTPSSPYRITNCSQLQELGGSTNGTYVLMNDIDCADTANWNEGKGFKPIEGFKGVFDGRSYAVWDLYINRPDEHAVGLLSTVPDGPTVIQNLWLEKTPANAERIDIIGRGDVGGVVGIFNGTRITNVHTKLNVRTRAVATDATGATGQAGGIAGVIRAGVEHSSSSGDVSVEPNNLTNRNVFVGGLVGAMSDYQQTNRNVNITNSYSTGSVTVSAEDNRPNGQCGGLVGLAQLAAATNSANINTSYSTGDVNCIDSDALSVGGFIGGVGHSGDADRAIQVQSNFSTSRVLPSERDTTKGFYGSYWKGQDLVLQGATDFSSNVFDSYRTQAALCGNVTEEVDCSSVNQDNTEPDYFTTLNPGGFLDSWDEEANWSFGESYPTHKSWAAMTNAPTSLSVTRDGGDFIASWAKPATDGPRTAQITDYLLSYRDVGQSTNSGWTIVEVGDNDTHTLSGLTVPGKYQFRIAARFNTRLNPAAYESGMQSDIFDFATGMPATAPPNIRVEAQPKTAKVIWETMPSVTAYDLEYRTAGETTWLNAYTPYASSIPQDQQNATELEAGLFEIDPLASYEVRMRAKNIAGVGPWSDAVPFTAPAQQQYSVSNCQQLQDMDDDVMGVYTLTNDIDCSNFDFQPIGLVTSLNEESGDVTVDSTPFLGTLNGAGYTISNLSIDVDLGSSASDDFRAVGLFGFTYRASIKDITIANAAVIANYSLSEEVDSDQNGLPDAPDLGIDDIETPEGVPTSGQEVTEAATSSFMSAQNVLGSLSPGLLSNIYEDMAKVAVGGAVGFAIGQGDYQDIRTVNTIVRGGLAGGVFGMVLPIKSVAQLTEGASIDLGEPITLSGIRSDGLVIGHLSGGLIGATASPLGNAFGTPTPITLINSSSSSEVQGNVAGGLIGLAVDSAAMNGYLRTVSLGGEAVESEVSNAIKEGVQYILASQNVIIKNSQSSGLVSACEALSGIRIAALGGLVGFGVGMHIDGSSSSSPVQSCSGTTSGWGVYGGLSGGLGGGLLASRITNSSSTGAITAINNDTPEQTSQVNMYLGASGGLAGLFVAGAPDANGKYAVDNSFSTGNISVDSKQGFSGASGGLLGIAIGSATIHNSHSTSNVTHHLIDSFIGGGSVAGGLTGITLGFDVQALLGFGFNFPNMPTLSHGFVIDGSYATGDIAVQKDGGGGSFAMGGGAAGLVIGQADIKNSYATGDVTGGLPDKVAIDGQPDYPNTIFANQNTKFGAAVSGGLVGASFGMDFPKFASRLGMGLSGLELPELEGGGITINNTYATGDIRGNLAGGLVGSADLRTVINKSYAEGDIRGAIVGGLVGQAGFGQTALGAGGITAFMALVVGASGGDNVDGNIAAAALADGGLRSIGPVSITNTYSTGKVTAVPGLADVTLVDGGVSVPADSIRLPSTAGGIAGLFMSVGGRISDSYASGDLTVEADQPVIDSQPLESGQENYIGKIPSVAGGIVGIDIAISTPSIELITQDAYESSENPKATDFTTTPQIIENVFSTSKMTLNSETLSGGSIGLFVSPLHILNTFLLGHTTPPEENADMFNVSNVYIDKSKINVANCNGPNKPAYEIAKPILRDTKVTDDEGDEFLVTKNANGDTVPIRELVGDDDQLLEAPVPETWGLGEGVEDFGDINTVLSDLLNVSTACEYVNNDNQQPRYFIQNNTNAPMNSWNFSNTWKVVKNDYPKFVAGVETEIPSEPGDPTNPTPPGSGTSTSVDRPGDTIVTLTPDQGRDVRETVTRVAQKAGFVRTNEKVKGLKAILANVPAFLAKSIPYSLILLLLILAAMYSYQALREYRLLSQYHASITRIINTKEAIDSYLAITTHYLNTPVAIMNGAVELLESLKKISATKSTSLKSKIKRLSDAAASLLASNQVSSAQAANDERLIKHDQPSPLKSRAVRVPAFIALGLIVLANVLFIYADVFNTSPFRIFVEFGLYILGVFLVALAYKYRNFMAATKQIAKQQLEMESRLYRRREAFIPEAIKAITEPYENLDIAAESLKKVPEAKLFLNGLHMLEGIKEGLTNVKKFANFDAETPLFDLSAHIQKAVHAASTEASARNITFDANIAPGLVGHMQPEAARQLVGSLLDNAVKFSKDGGQIQVTAYRRFGKLVFSVRDTGIGISEEKLPSLLRPFSRGTDSMQYNYEGLGIGLYTDKVITDRMGGSLTISSKLHEGTIVTVSIPFQHEAAATAPVLVTPEATAA